MGKKNVVLHIQNNLQASTCEVDKNSLIKQRPWAAINQNVLLSAFSCIWKYMYNLQTHSPFLRLRTPTHPSMYYIYIVYSVCDFVRHMFPSISNGSQVVEQWNSVSSELIWLIYCLICKITLVKLLRPSTARAHFIYANNWYIFSGDRSPTIVTG